MEKNYLVTKSNYFIMNSSYDLSLEEQKIILTLASMVQPNDEEFKPYIFKISDFMELLGVNTKTKYTEIPKITKDLMKKVFEIEEDDVIIQTAWLSSATYKKGSGIVELEFSPKLKPYMLKLNSMFTQYKLANILSMKSKYSPRIYEILKCNEFKKQNFVEIKITELRRLLKAENIYPLYSDFKRYIIIRTKKELKKLSDIWFEFEEIKTGRKVTSIRFYIYSNNIENGKKVYNFKEEDAITLIDTQDLSEDDKIFELYNLFKEYKIGFESIKNILFNANGDIEKVKKVYEYSKTQDINNFVGFMISMVKKDTFITPKAKA
ncbi:replication initiation protein [Clostridium perfringens]|uniref:Initiator RepB protein family n=2 Tax=Clostridium perfringens TaxID=1502 RepID=Q0SW56_CLOPS|nr:replication initiation protein [Clostridium perfringens]ABG87145.1 Initiator RepB protein family [Clostridium perfringens SM101]MBP2860361.1 replication initiation protein [Clostridium perfringens]MDG6878207.1 Replication initiation protein [Clostridium perfringens]MDG6880826.1 Replication initiation protein [Clostridium perfringens]MDG6887846.1 Replication initiation protein [Clostridium perfringens]